MKNYLLSVKQFQTIIQFKKTIKCILECQISFKSKYCAILAMFNVLCGVAPHIHFSFEYGAFRAVLIDFWMSCHEVFKAKN